MLAMPSFPKVAIIVLNHNGQDCLTDCLTSLAASAYPNKEILVVDNGSTDVSLEEARQQFPHFIYLLNESNLGFAAGMNVGIREALKRGADWCLLFNYDATIDERALSILIEQSRAHSEAGLLCPLILKADSDTVWFGKGRINFFRMRTEHLLPSKKDLSQTAYPSEFLTGCALLIRRSVLETVGLLDENFFLYYEDADFCLRTRISGFETLVVPSARVWHREKSQSNPQKLYYLVLSGLLFFHKHTPSYFRPYFALYVTIRRIKNYIDTLLGRENADLVRQAYEDGTKKPFLFSHFR